MFCPRPWGSGGHGSPRAPSLLFLGIFPLSLTSFAPSTAVGPKAVVSRPLLEIAGGCLFTVVKSGRSTSLNLLLFLPGEEPGSCEIWPGLQLVALAFCN